MNNLYVSIYKSLIIVSVILFIISITSSGQTNVGSLITGYVTLLLSLMMLLNILITKLITQTQSQSLLSLIGNILVNIGPFLLIMGIISFLLYLVIYYKDIIISNRVSSSYYSFTFITLLLLLYQIYTLYKSINIERLDVIGNIPKVTSGIMYLFSVITLSSSFIVYSILKYFTTDG